MMDTFKKNSEWSKVRVVMADKDVGERENPSPHAASVYHTLHMHLPAEI